MIGSALWFCAYIGTSAGGSFMTESIFRTRGIGLSILCIVLLFVTVERYNANVASVQFMNQMMHGGAPSFELDSSSGPIKGNMQISMPGQSQGAPFTPGIPAICSYALLFAVLSGAGAVACFVQAQRVRSGGAY
jgi:hypothetical protein